MDAKVDSRAVLDFLQAPQELLIQLRDAGNKIEFRSTIDFRMMI
jgi:hypothetical protein